MTILFPEDTPMEELVRYGLITREQFEHARRLQSRRGCRIGEALLELGYVNERIIKAYVKRVIGR